MNKWSIICALSLSVVSAATARAQQREVIMPRPRDVPATEQEELAKLVALQLERDPPPDLRYAAAGAYRFADSADFRYFDRNDLGSVALELASYGIADKPLDAARLDPDQLIEGALRALERRALDTSQLRFSRFFDEFVGAAEPDLLKPDFDPRSASIQVARTLLFERLIDDVPIFGSEVLVGLNEDGTVGRLRYHAPKISARLIRSAGALRDTVAGGKWQLPDSLRANDTEVLEVRAGVGHSSFASPDYRSTTVVRVLYRRSGGDGDQRLQTTRYVYFDARGNEVLLDEFPQLPSSSESEKTR